MQKAEIRLKLKERDVKKAALARYLGITRQGLDYHLNGEGDIDTDIANKIMKFLNPNIDDLKEADRIIKRLESKLQKYFEKFGDIE